MKKWVLNKRRIETEHWKLHDGVLSEGDWFTLLYHEVVPMCRERSGSRKSCLFGNFHYTGVACYSFQDMPPPLQELLKRVTHITHREYDYLLVHLYPDGQSSIGWHNDKEAFGSTVASVSFGATRKFRFRHLGRTTGYDHQIVLRNGDLLEMKPGCQEEWEHTVPVESTVKEPRINLTFRQTGEKIHAEIAGNNSHGKRQPE